MSLFVPSFVPSDFLVDGQVSGLGTVHPILTLSFVSTWILPLHVMFSTLKRKSSSSVMDGLQRRKKKICIDQRRLVHVANRLICVLNNSLASDGWVNMVHMSNQLEVLIEHHSIFSFSFGRRNMFTLQNQ